MSMPPWVDALKGWFNWRRRFRFGFRCLATRLHLCGAMLLLGADVRAEDFFTTNRNCLPHFWAAAEDARRPVTVVSFGDSMADSNQSATYFLISRLANRLGVSGIALGNCWNELLFVATNGASVIEGPSAYWFAKHWWVIPGGRLHWYAEFTPGGVMSDTVGLFWAAQPSGGRFTLSISTNGGPWSPLLTLDGYSAEPEGRHTNVFLARNWHRLSVEGQTGYNCIIGPQLLDSQSNGLQVAFMYYPSIDLGQVTNVPATIREPVFRGLQPDLLVWHMKEEGDALTISNRLEECERWWSSSSPNCDVLYLGSTWAYFDSSTTRTLDQNRLVRQAAIRHHRAYADLMSPAQNFSWLVEQGYISDAVHLNRAGGDWAAGILWNEFGFYALRRPRQLELARLGPQVQLSYPTATGILYSVEATTNLTDWHPVHETVGTGGRVSTNLPNDLPARSFRLSLRPAP